MTSNKVTDKEASLIDNNICPDCGGKGFFEGPSGGSSVNVICVNKECGARFNLPGPFRPERISYDLSKKQMIKFRCWNCNDRLSMPEKYIGRKGRCPKCKEKNTIPSPEDTLENSIMMLFKDIEDSDDEKWEKKYKLKEST